MSSSKQLWFFQQRNPTSFAQVTLAKDNRRR